MQPEIGAIVEGKVTGITTFGAFVELPDGKVGLIHISEVSTDYVREIKDYLQVGQMVKAKVLGLTSRNEISLSIKKLQAANPNGNSSGRPFNKGKFDGKPSGGGGRPGGFERRGAARKSSGNSFEDMLSSFKHASEEKISGLKRTKDSRRGGSRRGAQR